MLSRKLNIFYSIMFLRFMEAYTRRYYMFKSKSAILLISFILLILSACGSQADEIDEDGNSTDDYEITLNYSDHDPPNEVRTELLKEYWFHKVKEETDGKETINEQDGAGLS